MISAQKYMERELKLQWQKEFIKPDKITPYELSIPKFEDWLKEINVMEDE